MRMKNPFGQDPGEDNGGEEPAHDPIAPPDEEERDEEPGPEVSESRASEPAETSQSESPETRTSESAASDETEQAKSPKHEKGHGHHLLHEGEFTAPSAGPHTHFEKRKPLDRLNLDQISGEDAMGQDKRRTVVGKSYGPSRTRVFATFATFFAVVAALAVGFYFLAQELDAAPEENPDVAPWSAADAPQKPPKPLQ